MSKLLLGKDVADGIAAAAAQDITRLERAGIVPTLAIVRVGQNPSDLSYERGVTKRAESMGVRIESVVLPETAGTEGLLAAIERVNADPGIHGCLMFRPLPEGFDEAAACNAIAPEKDVDAVSNASMAGVFCDQKDAFAPSTAVACMKILDFYHIDPAEKNVVVIGRSLVVGKPVAMLLLARNATVTICHSRTHDLDAIARAADIVICATGRARAFGADFFSEGQTVIDVGINFDDEGRLCGDVDFDAVSAIVGAITPVPRGAGSVTSSVTLEHTVLAAKRVLSQA